MRYTDTHKEETHQKVLKAASRLLREKGPDRLTVPEVMASAGLTHGGFYAHFKSKDDLIAETIDSIFAFSRVRAGKMLDGMPAAHALATFIDFYVSADHRDHPTRGCPLVMLSSDMPRQSKKVRTAFDAGAQSLKAMLRRYIGELGLAEPDALAATVLSAMAGAVALARAVTDKALSDDLLISARANIKARLGITDMVLSQKAQA
ncbi:MAG TPA: TetR/AcrR family transcriptional regulator [Rhizomicrobium sp.]|nr:TetR/AcrR family transcriptional regulator [Rhizomicrobium sp.]